MTTLTEQERYYKTKRWLIIGLVLAAIAIVFFVWRGCENEKKANSAYAQIEKRLKDVLDNDQKIRDSANELEKEFSKLEETTADLVADLELTRGALIDESDKSNSLEIALRKAKEKKDTAAQLSICDSVVKVNKTLNSYVLTLQKRSASLNTTRLAQINNLEKQRDHWKRGYDSCFSAAKDVDSLLPSVKPKSKLYIDGAVKFGAVYGVGGGLSLIDTKGNKFLSRASYTNFGAVYEVGYGRVLSFKRKK